MFLLSSLKHLMTDISFFHVFIVQSKTLNDRKMFNPRHILVFSINYLFTFIKTMNAIAACCWSLAQKNTNIETFISVGVE